VIRSFLQGLAADLAEYHSADYADAEGELERARSLRAKLSLENALIIRAFGPTFVAGSVPRNPDETGSDAWMAQRFMRQLRLCWFDAKMVGSWALVNLIVQWMGYLVNPVDHTLLGVSAEETQHWPRFWMSIEYFETEDQRPEHIQHAIDKLVLFGSA
jgi:hypothetical protein